MADSASMVINGSYLPDEIQKKFIGETYKYTPANDTEGWYYKLTNVTTTASIDGYNTPFAFTDKKCKKKKKKISTNITGYEVVSEALDKRDIAIIKKVIRDVVGDVIRDIWLKRTSWQ